MGTHSDYREQAQLRNAAGEATAQEVHKENPRAARPWRRYLTEKKKGKKADVDLMVQLRKRFAQKPKTPKRLPKRGRKGRGHPQRRDTRRSRGPRTPNTRGPSRPAQANGGRRR